MISEIVADLKVRGSSAVDEELDEARAEGVLEACRGGALGPEQYGSSCSFSTWVQPVSGRTRHCSRVADRRTESIRYGEDAITVEQAGGLPPQLDRCSDPAGDPP